jgi:hypothetical protein
MAHAVIIEDQNGDAIDAVYYCSDAHARDHSAYAGWNGCVAPSVDERCPSCGAAIPGEQ